MTKENNPDTHKLLEHLDVLVIEHNSKLQVFFKLPDLYRLFTSENFDDFATYKEDLEEMSRFDSFIIIKGLYGVETRYYKIEDFNEIVDVILQENLLDVTLPFTPAINQRKVKSFAKKNVETLLVTILEESIVNADKKTIKRSPKWQIHHSQWVGVI